VNRPWDDIESCLAVQMASPLICMTISIYYADTDFNCLWEEKKRKEISVDVVSYLGVVYYILVCEYRQGQNLSLTLPSNLGKHHTT